MRIPIAIYTAIEGYAWQPGTDLTIAFLNKAKAAIGKFPDPSRGEMPFGGAVVAEGCLVVYRYHLARAIDSFGRDALYVVLGAIPLDEAPKVNVRELLDHPSFAEPKKPLPPLTVEYAGSGSEPCPFDFRQSFERTVPFAEALAWLGDVVAVRPGSLAVACTRATEQTPRLNFAFQAPPPPPPPPLPSPPSPPLPQLPSLTLMLERFLYVAVSVLFVILVAIVVMVVRVRAQQNGSGDFWSWVKAEISSRD